MHLVCVYAGVYLFAANLANYWIHQPTIFLCGYMSVCLSTLHGCGDSKFETLLTACFGLPLTAGPHEINNHSVWKCKAVMIVIESFVGIFTLKLMFYITAFLEPAHCLPFSLLYCALKYSQNSDYSDYNNKLHEWL